MSRHNKSDSAEFELVNPLISKVKTTAQASSPAQALKEIWEGDVSRHLSSHVPSMYVTMQNKQTGGLTHHEIRESQNGDKVRFTVSKPLKNVKMSEEQKEKFESEVRRVRREHQGGGADDDKKDDKDRDHKKKSRKHRKDDSSSSSSSSSSSDDDTYKRRRRTKVKYDDVWLPPTQWWYASMYGADYLYIPTFISPLTPSIQVSTDWVPVLLY